MVFSFALWLYMGIIGIASVVPIEGSLVENDIVCVNTWNATAEHSRQMKISSFGAPPSWLPTSCFYHGQNQRHCEQGFAVAGQSYLYFWSQDLIWHKGTPTSEKSSFATACLSGEQVCASAISYIHTHQLSSSNYGEWYEQGECRHEEVHPNGELSVMYRLSYVSQKACTMLRKTWKREFRSCFPWPPPLFILDNVEEILMAKRMEQAEFLVGLAQYGVMTFLLILTFVFLTRILHF